MNIAVPWEQGSTLSQLVSYLHQEFQRAPPQLLECLPASLDTLSRPSVYIDFSSRLKELGLERVQALTEEDVTGYAMTVPQLGLIYTNRDMLLKECADLASSHYSETNVLLRDRIVEERAAVQAELAQIEKKTKEFSENLFTLRSLSKVLHHQTSDAAVSEIESELADLTARQSSLLSSLRTNPSPDNTSAYLQLRTRFRELEVLRSLLRS